MAKGKTPTAEEDKRAAQRQERLAEKVEDDEDLDEALEDSFPASDPPSMTQPETEVGAPSRSRKPDLKPGQK